MLLALVVAVFTGCATGNFGSFAERTFFDRSEYENIRELGPVKGESSQIMVLYVFPYQSPSSTEEALKNALDQYKNTVFIGDVSVESRQHWLIGYSKMCTVVSGTAYTADKIKE